jgi:hypothetical protein
MPGNRPPRACAAARRQARFRRGLDRVLRMSGSAGSGRGCAPPASRSGHLGRAAPAMRTRRACFIPVAGRARMASLRSVRVARFGYLRRGRRRVVGALVGALAFRRADDRAAFVREIGRSGASGVEILGSVIRHAGPRCRDGGAGKCRGDQKPCQHRRHRAPLLPLRCPLNQKIFPSKPASLSRLAACSVSSEVVMFEPADHITRRLAETPRAAPRLRHPTVAGLPSLPG